MPMLKLEWTCPEGHHNVVKTWRNEDTIDSYLDGMSLLAEAELDMGCQYCNPIIVGEDGWEEVEHL